MNQKAKPMRKCGRWALKLFFWVFGLVLTLALAWLATHTYYKLTPSALSPRTIALNEQAARLPRDTESSLRLYGLFAPKELDPVAFGRCRLAAHRKAEVLWKKREENNLVSEDNFESQSAAHAKESALLEEACAQGFTPLHRTDAQSPSITPATTASEWQALREPIPDPILIQRAEAIWANPDLALVGELTTVQNYGGLQYVRQWHLAQSLAEWESGNASKAVQTWRNAIQSETTAAKGTLIEAMVAVVNLTRTALTMQKAASHSPPDDSGRYQLMLDSLSSIDSVVDATEPIFLQEWLFKSSWINKDVGLPPPSKPWLEHFTTVLWQLQTDQNELLNAFALSNDCQAATARSSALGKAPGIDQLDSLCSPWDSFTPASLFGRNPALRFITSRTTPDFTSYGTRIADLRNLAAATRLTIEARRQGLHGEALIQFVAEAPENMRDIFSKAPFTYDPGQRRLTIQLREKSTVLGEGSYTLPL